MTAFNQVKLSTASAELIFPAVPNFSDAYQMLSVTGIGPMPIEVNTTPSTSPGTVYSGSHASDRELTLLFRLNPDWKTQETPSQLRSKLYSLLSGGRGNYVTVTLQSELVEAYTIGYVKTIDVSVYTRNPEAQITILCPNPYFQSTTLDEYATVETTRDIEGVTWYEYKTDVDNESAAPSGLRVEAALTPHTDLKFELESTYSDKLGFVGPPLENAVAEDFTIVTIPGEREIMSSEQGFMIGFMTPVSKWPMLSSATETVTFRSTTQATGVFVWVRKQWWGF